MLPTSFVCRKAGGNWLLLRESDVEGAVRFKRSTKARARTGLQYHDRTRSNHGSAGCRPRFDLCRRLPAVPMMKATGARFRKAVPLLPISAQSRDQSGCPCPARRGCGRRESRPCTRGRGAGIGCGRPFSMACAATRTVRGLTGVNVISTGRAQNVRIRFLRLGQQRACTGHGDTLQRFSSSHSSLTAEHGRPCAHRVIA